MEQLFCDVLVAGGGVAGVCAALAAARSGVRTIIAERHGYLGGIGYAGMLQHICGLYLNGDTPPYETLNGGLTRELAGLLAADTSLPIRKIGQVYVLPYTPRHLLTTLDTLVSSEQHLTVMRDTRVTSVATEQGSIRTVAVETPHSSQTITAGAVIDASGSGDVAVIAGAGFELAPEHDRQLAGFSIRLSNLLTDDDTLALKVPYCCARAAAQHQLPPLARFTTFTPGETPGEGCLKMSLDGDTSPERDELARATAQSVFTLLRENVPAFRDAVIMEMALGVMEREGRRIIGGYTLTGDDVAAARKFPDAIVKNAWPMELWDRTHGPRYRYVPRGDYYEIPFRCITVAGITNLLTAGRCISASHEALGSTRVMGTCMALGEQAGRAAAHFVRQGKFPEVFL